MNEAQFAEFRGSVSATLSDLKNAVERVESRLDKIEDDLKELAVKVGRLNGSAKVWGLVWGALAAAVFSGLFALISRAGW